MLDGILDETNMQLIEILLIYKAGLSLGKGGVQTKADYMYRLTGGGEGVKIG